MAKIKEYSKIEACIANLKTQYATVPDVSTEKGLADCKKMYREVRKVEINLDNKRKDLNSDAQAHIKKVNDEAKRIDGLLKEISAPFKAAADKRDAEIKEAEAKRVKEIHDEIAGIRAFSQEAIGKNAQEISDILEAVDLIDCKDGFDEFTAEALTAVDETKQALTDLLHAALEKEAQEEAQRKIDAERLQLRIQESINKLQMIPVDFIDSDAAAIDTEISRLESYEPPFEEFGERQSEAAAVVASVLEKLQNMRSLAELSAPEPVPASSPAASAVVHEASLPDSSFDSQESEDPRSAEEIDVSNYLVEHTGVSLSQANHIAYLLVIGEVPHFSPIQTTQAA
jgi:hypothetical protein